MRQCPLQHVNWLGALSLVSVTTSWAAADCSFVCQSALLHTLRTNIIGIGAGPGARDHHRTWSQLIFTPWQPENPLSRDADARICVGGLWNQGWRLSSTTQLCAHSPQATQSSVDRLFC